METSPVTCRTLEEFYHIDGHTFEKQYKEVLSGFRDWDQLEHADKWLLFPDNIGTRIAIDESSLSNGELYTFVTNRDARTREKSLIAVVAGTKSEDVIDALRRIDEEKRLTVEEITLDLSDSMRKIVRTAFPKADAEDLLELLDKLNADDIFGICWDTGHANLAQVNQPAAIQQIGSRLKALHINDNRGEKDDHLLPYLGYVEWTPLLKSLADVNYQGDFTYEIHNFTGGMSPEIHQQGVEFSVLVARQMVSEIEKGMKEK